MNGNRRINFEKKLTAKKSLPLYGKHILLTSPRIYSGILVKLLIERGAKPVCMPTIEIEPMENYEELDNSIKNISRFDWIGFTSRNGIEAFFDRLEALNIKPEAVFKAAKTCVIGADAAALENRGIKPDLVPSEASPKGIVEDFKRMNISRETILLPVPEVVGMKEPRVVPDFVDGLQGIGITVTRVPAYTTSPVTNSYAVEKKMLLNGEIDVVTFTSTAEIDSMLTILGKDKNTLQQTTIACVGPYTGAGAKNFGLDVKIMPEEEFSSFHCLVETMEDFFRKKF